MIGAAEQTPEGTHVLDEQGRERVVITGGKGDQGLRRAIAYLRKRALPKAEKTSGGSLFADIGSEVEDAL
jgi:hypothetical protein